MGGVGGRVVDEAKADALVASDVGRAVGQQLVIGGMEGEPGLGVGAVLGGLRPADVVPVAVGCQEPADVGELDAGLRQGRLDHTLGRAGHADVDQGGLRRIDVIDVDSAAVAEGAGDRDDASGLCHAFSSSSRRPPVSADVNRGV